jgi:hypothetical protein
MVQVVEHVASKHKAQSSKPQYQNKRGKLKKCYNNGEPIDSHSSGLLVKNKTKQKSSLCVSQAQIDKGHKSNSPIQQCDCQAKAEIGSVTSQIMTLLLNMG